MTGTASTWTSFGASVVGPAHATSSRPNQDAWFSFHRSWGDGIVVSDGLGSKVLSDLGSDAACRAVARASREFAVSGKPRDSRKLPEAIGAAWLEEIVPLDPRDTSATCLYALRLGDGKLRLGILGDGCVAAVKRNGSVVVLREDKGSSFSNTTTALGPTTKSDEWQVLDVDEAECRAVILCSDGVADDLEDVEGFMADFVEVHCRLARVTASRRLRAMLATWPVPKHSDDKTLGCLYRSEDVDD